MKKSDHTTLIRILVLVILQIGLVHAVPLPLGIDGYIYYNDGITPVFGQVKFSITDVNNGFYIEGPVSSAFPGRYSAVINGEKGDMIFVRAWNDETDVSENFSIQGSVHNFNLVLDLDVPNIAPAINSAPVIHAIEDEQYLYDVEATDANDDTIIYGLVDYPENMTIDSETGLIQWMPVNSEVGEHSIGIVASDGELQTSQNYSLTVINVNDKPIIISQPLVVAEIGESYTYDIDATDEDGDVLAYYLSVNPVDMTIDEDTGLIGWMPDLIHIGENPVSVIVSDGFLVDEQNFTIVVNAQQNRNPVIASSPLGNVSQDSLYFYDVEATDPDGDVLLYHMIEGPVGMAIDESTGLLQWVPEDADVGIHYVRLQVLDGKGGSAEQDFYLMVFDTNDAPIITSQPALSAHVFKPYIYKISAYDPEGDKLTYSLVEGPDRMQLSKRTHRLFWLPFRPGTYPVKIQVSDGDKYVIQEFEIKVSYLWRFGFLFQRTYFFAVPAKTEEGYQLDVENPESPIVRVNFDSEKELPEVSIETMLNAPSEYAGSLSGFRYMFVNMTPEIDEKTNIVFRIDSRWMEEYGIPEESIVLKRYSGNSWIDLDTDFVRTDENYSYYAADSSELGFFSISSLMEPDEIVSGTNTRVLSLVRPLKEPFVIQGTVFFSDGYPVPAETDIDVRAKNISARTGILTMSGAYLIVVPGNKGDKIMMEVSEDRYHKEIDIILSQNDISQNIYLDITRSQYRFMLLKKSLFSIVTKLFKIILLLSIPGFIFLYMIRKKQTDKQIKRQAGKPRK
ncbi:MAG: PGF-pre-PGF domain-containing protein [Nanoarchaeota archaeon]|nr:PGF-pre-PGF domain-containing protein [Nanoarchaeota archaeon]